MGARFFRAALLAVPMLLASACGDSTLNNEADAINATSIDALPVPEGPASDDLSNTVVGSIRNLPDTVRFMAALTSSGVGKTLVDGGPYTIFVPSDSAFDSLPDGELDKLMTPENKARMAAIVNYHVVKGAIKASDLRSLIKKGGGTAVIKTLDGSDLTAKAEDDMITLTDNTGKVATIGASDIAAGNGTVHLIDKLLLPNPG
ncbi:MAG: fasciclin domain-containing protein [Sphingomonadales bacterium]|nr:fasciclin domain-containing protein [Sphingomonadales bacterium]